MRTHRRIRVLKFESGRETRIVDDATAAEEPLEIAVDGRSLAVVMRTPGHDRELAAGFLFSEGLIGGRRDLLDITGCGEGETEGNRVEALLARPAPEKLESLTRHVFTSSSCGICGKATIESAFQHFPAVEPGPDFTVGAEVLLGLPGALAEHQETFAVTGGLHACAVFDAGGKLLAVREDVGRHNAVDKILGWALWEGRIPLDHHVLMVSGRTSFEIVQKALAARIPVVAAISAPSSLAVEFCRESGQTLVGFLRGKRMNVYSHPERIGGMARFRDTGLA